MDKTRILPPLVRGRVTGVLDLFVDEIRLFRNILLLTDHFDLVLQVQWWGEVLPAFIRPKEVHVEGKNSRKTHSLESYYHSAQYEIKTSFELFKTYLKNCEVLELSVLEAFENYVVGSAFLKDLISVLCSNNELIRMPIFDYLGGEIGEVVVHVNFLQKPLQDEILNKSTEILKNNTASKTPEKENYNILSKINSSYLTLGEKTIFYDGHSNEEVAIVDVGLPIKLDDFRKNENTNSNLSLTVSNTSNSLCDQESKINNKKGSKESIYACLPEIETVNDASKVLYFGAPSQKSKPKTDLKKPKITNKFNSNSIKCKTKYPERTNSLPINKLSGKLVTKKPDAFKNSTKNPTTSKKENEIDHKASSTSSGVAHSEIKSICEPTDLKNIPSKQSNVKVLDYLLGSDMSKEDEQVALNDFKKMSPSHNLVDSINQLCLASDTKKSVNRFQTNSPASQKWTLLNFNFNNPIERNYYEKFFLKTNSHPDFEIAELLNRPDNSFMLDKFEEIRHLRTEPQIGRIQNINKYSVGEREVKAEDDYFVNVSFPDRRNPCARCKYYKKLNELDTIIESLKHFEQKMVSHEKDLQSVLNDNSDMLINRNHK